MPSTQRSEQLFANVVRLRDAQASLPDDEGLAAVITDLERELGPTVTRSLAAKLLGVSHSALNRWVKRGDVPVVVDLAGKPGVPVSALLRMYDSLREQRSTGTRSRHVLEPLILDGHQRARRLAASKLLDDAHGAGESGGHERATRRARAYHAAVARRLRRADVQEARRQLSRWRAAGRIAPTYADEWERILACPLPEIRRLITENTSHADDLRQNSPLAGLLSEAERRAINEQVR